MDLCRAPARDTNENVTEIISIEIQLTKFLVIFEYILLFISNILNWSLPSQFARHSMSKIYTQLKVKGNSGRSCGDAFVRTLIDLSLTDFASNSAT